MACVVIHPPGVTLRSEVPYVGATEIKARRLVLAIRYHSEIGNPGQLDFPGLYLGGQSTSPEIVYNLIEPNTEFDPYRTQLNIRFSKVITVGDVRTRVYMDASNLFNQARVTRRNQTYGSAGIKNPDFLRVLGIEQGRVLSFGLQSSF